MCGLSGVMSSTISVQEENIFRDLLNVSSLRGHEGAGVIVSQVFGMKKFPVIRACRSKGIAGRLAYGEHLQDLLKPRVNAIIGHARWPTKGGNDIGAIHPHRSGHIVGVHNGTLWTVAGEPVKDRSDSAMLFESFAKIGVAETMKNTEGAYALVWVDEQDQTINFLRNAQRSLFFTNVGWQENANTIYWSSEREMLDFVFARSFKGNNSWATYLPIHRWYKYPLEVKHIIRPLSVVDCKPEEKPVVHYPHSGRYQGHGHHHRRRAWEEFDYPEEDQTLNPTSALTDDLPWASYRDMKTNTVVTLVRDPLTGKMVTKESYAPPLLPPPKGNVEDRLKELSERPSTEASVDLQPPPKPMSKQAQKRQRKQEQKEARDEAKRLARFQRDLAKGVNSTKEVAAPEPETEVMDNSSDDLNDEIPDFGASNTHDAQSTDDRTFSVGTTVEEHFLGSRASRHFLECAGRGCAWCGEVANAGDAVYPTSSDVISKDFLCHECGSRPEVLGYIRDKNTVVAC